MKTVVKIVLLSVLIGLALGDLNSYDGKPGCHTIGEIGHLYRNFWDPTKYWRCVALNAEAIEEHCDEGTAFFASLERCIAWIDWYWEPTVIPPSRPFADLEEIMHDIA